MQLSHIILTCRKIQMIWETIFKPKPEKFSLDWSEVSWLDLKELNCVPSNDFEQLQTIFKLKCHLAWANILIAKHIVI